VISQFLIVIPQLGTLISEFAKIIEISQFLIVILQLGTVISKLLTGISLLGSGILVLNPQ